MKVKTKTSPASIKRSSRKPDRVRSVRSSNERVGEFIRPMLAQIHDKPFDDEEWIFEVKWDGYRAIAEVSKGDVRLYSRNGLSFLRLYPVVAEALKKLSDDVVLDGEIVVLDKSGRPDFQKLQQYDHNPSLRIVYYVFDCLSFRGQSLLHLPLVERKKYAKQAIPKKSDVIRYSDHVSASGVDFFSKVADMDLEGMIAKRAASLYVPGKRSKDWLKIKNHNTQEAVIAGYTAPRGSRQYFGALILGLYSGKNKKLKYIGHTGTGFTASTLKKVYETLHPLRRGDSPFDEKVPVNAPVTWVDPVIVCSIKFTEATADGILRHPVFSGLRIDKPAEEATTLDVTVKTESKKKKKSGKASGGKTGKSRKKTTKRVTGAQSADPKEKRIRAGSHTVTVSNHDKLYWPEEEITKGDLVEFYNGISKYILPYLKNRPQSLKRNPQGIRDKGFFHKDAGGDAPEWVDTVSLHAESANRDIEYILCNNKATLLYLNNLGCIELNPWNSRVSKPDNPDYLVMDLDPSDENTFNQVIDTANVVREVLDKAGAVSYCKTSGATGLHIYVPLKARYNYDEVRGFAEIVAQMTRERLPEITTVERSLNKRDGRIYLDYQQNKRGQTLASVYSVRPKPGAPVSTPLLWKEVKAGLQPGDFNIFNIAKRLEKTGDLFSGVLKESINLRKCLKNLGV